MSVKAVGAQLVGKMKVLQKSPGAGCQRNQGMPPQDQQLDM